MKAKINQVSLVIATYNEEESIAYVLDELSTYDFHEIIIVDNDNDLALKKNILKDFEIYQYLTNEKNIGFTRAANIAIGKLTDQALKNLL